MTIQPGSAPMAVFLRWTGGERFEGNVDETALVLDGNDPEALSPMKVVLSGLAGCMGIDIAMILEKGRQPLESLEVRVQGRRAEDPPRRFVAYDMEVRVNGAVDREKVERAVALSKEKYCSVWHSLGQDAPLDVTISEL